MYLSHLWLYFKGLEFSWCSTFPRCFLSLLYFPPHSLFIWSNSSPLLSSPDSLSSTWFIQIVRLPFEFYNWVIQFFNSIFISAWVFFCISMSLLHYCFQVLACSCHLLQPHAYVSLCITQAYILPNLFLISLICSFLSSSNTLKLQMKFIVVYLFSF